MDWKNVDSWLASLYSKYEVARLSRPYPRTERQASLAILGDEIPDPTGRWVYTNVTVNT